MEQEDEDILKQHEDSHENQKEKENPEILDWGELVTLYILGFKVRAEDNADSADVVEAHDERNEDHELNERKEEVAGCAGYQLFTLEREIQEARLNDENEGRTEHFSQEQPKSRKQGEDRCSRLERGALSISVVKSRAKKEQNRHTHNNSQI